MFFDISIEFDDGELADIELQARNEDYDYGIRAEIIAARLLANSAKRNKKWDSPKVYQISVLNFHYKKDDKKEMRWYTMIDDSGAKLSEHGIMAAQNIVKHMSKADSNWFSQFSSWKTEYDQNTKISNAEKRGREQGIQQGAYQNAIETAIKMLKDNLPTDKTAQYSGLPLEKVMELQESIEQKI